MCHSMCVGGREQLTESVLTMRVLEERPQLIGLVRSTVSLSYFVGLNCSCFFTVYYEDDSLLTKLPLYLRENQLTQGYREKN